MDDRRSRIKFRMTYILRFILRNKNPYEIHEGFLLYIGLFCFTIHHPLNTIFISHRSIVSSPKHIGKWHSNSSIFRKCLKEALCLATCIRMKGNMDIVPFLNAKSHRCRSIRTHKYMTTKNRKRYMHDQIFICIAQCRHAFSRRHLTKSMDSSNKFSTKDRLIELKNFFCVIWEVKIRSCVGHKFEKRMRTKSYSFLAK